ncbi:MAG: GNAT family N-acetyltransferase [Myxococcota bacterium]
MAIRDAEPADLDALSALAAETLPGAWPRSSLASELSVRGGCIRVDSHAPGPLLGFAILREAAGEAEILALAVAPGERRRGLGRRLVDDAVAWAASRGAGILHLELRGSNRPARALYEAAGFVVRGGRPRYYRDGEDALLMTRDASNPTRPPEAGPPPLRERAEIVWNRDEGGANRRLGLRVAGWTRSEPGQFVMLSAGACGEVVRTDPLLPRPMAVYRENAVPGGAEIEILYKVSGRGTGLLAEARVGERLRLVGPLGRGFAPPRDGVPALLVGGGTGIASLYGLAARSAARGPVSVLLGGRSAGDLMGREDFAQLDLALEVSTEDGSDGRRGLVTELLEEALGRTPQAVVYACGPTPMMRRCAEIAAAAGAPCQVSLENGMACGFGVCLGCAAPVSAGGFALVCRDGPVFEAGDVRWDGLP